MHGIHLKGIRMGRALKAGPYAAAVFSAALLLPPGPAASAPREVYKIEKPVLPPGAAGGPAPAEPAPEEEQSRAEAVETAPNAAEPASKKDKATAETVTSAPHAAEPAPEADASGAEKPEAPETPRYVYQPEGKTDPFEPFIAEQEEMEETRKRKPRTYLETLELSQLDLIAIIESPKGNWAMVRDGKGIGYSVRKGTAIGTKEGVVEHIRGNHMVIKEIHRDIRGKKKIKRVRKELRATQ